MIEPPIAQTVADSPEFNVIEVPGLYEQSV